MGQIRSLQQMDELCGRAWQAGERVSAIGQVTLTNGCFDILHRGHIETIRFAKGQGDILIVAVNTDESVRALKGPHRPIHKLDDRMACVAAIAGVDYVVPFGTAENSSIEPVVELLKPEVLVKGGDYSIDGVVGACIVEKYGGMVVIAPKVSGASTTAITAAIGQEVLDAANKVHNATGSFPNRVATADRDIVKILDETRIADSGMKPKTLVYLACPYSHDDPGVRAQRFELANRAAGILMRQGLHIFSPISHTHPIAISTGIPLGWEFWQTYDRAILESCCAVIVLTIPGWKESRGVKGELQIAKELGIRVSYMEPGEIILPVAGMAATKASAKETSDVPDQLQIVFKVGKLEIPVKWISKSPPMPTFERDGDTIIPPNRIEIWLTESDRAKIREAMRTSEPEGHLAEFPDYDVWLEGKRVGKCGSIDDVCCAVHETFATVDGFRRFLPGRAEAGFWFRPDDYQRWADDFNAKTTHVSPGHWEMHQQAVEGQNVSIPISVTGTWRVDQIRFLPIDRGAGGFIHVRVHGPYPSDEEVANDSL